MVSTADCRCEGAGSNICTNFHVTSRCLLVNVQYSVGPAAEWSKLSFSSPELLAHAVGFRFESCQ